MVNRLLLNETEARDGSVNEFTIMEKLCVALKLGVPLAVTSRLIGLVVFAWVTNGRHEKAPVAAFNVALVGALNRLKVSVGDG